MADWIDNDINIFNNIKNKGPFLGDDGASDGDSHHRHERQRQFAAG